MTSSFNVPFARPAAGAARGLSDASVTRLQNISGYSTPTFTAKSAQRQVVVAAVALKGFVPAELVPLEVAWFYDQLGIDDTYFANESSDEICDHIIALYGAKVVAYTKKDMQQLGIDLEKIQKPVNPGDRDGALFIHTSPPGITVTEGPGATCERRFVPGFSHGFPPIYSNLILILFN